eukprot:1161346-Pelagomonas_calceolata.AAC.10
MHLEIKEDSSMAKKARFHSLGQLCAYHTHKHSCALHSLRSRSWRSSTPDGTSQGQLAAVT